MNNRIGQQIGNYRLSRLLGQGGFAEVYLGEHLYLKTQAALKFLHGRLSEQQVQDFLHEAQTLAALKHPHIMRISDFGLEQMMPYIVMDYAPHGTLRDRHPRGTIVPLPQVLTYVKQIGAALTYIHEHQLIHRDIKPENMLLDEQNQVQVSDFGIAAIAHRTDSIQIQNITGTARYMAPEQFRGYPMQASDQYSLGILVYEWLCGECPFEGANFIEVGMKHATASLPSLRQKVPALSLAIEQAVFTALAKEPRQRFASIQAFAYALEQALQPARLSTLTTGQTTFPPPPPKGVTTNGDQHTQITPIKLRVETNSGQAKIRQTSKANKSVVTFGSTVSEAVNLALSQLGRQRHEVDIVVLQKPSHQWLGFKKTEACVRVTVTISALRAEEAKRLNDEKRLNDKKRLNDEKIVKQLQHNFGNRWQKFSNCRYNKQKMLITLSLYKLGLSQVPSEVWHLSSLQKLDVSDNQLDSLPAELGYLSSLQELRVGGNQLDSLPAELGYLSSLQELWVGGNQLTSLPAEVWHLSSLQTLHVANNQLTSLPAEVRHLSSLQTLWVGGNRLTSLPAELGHLSSLQYLEASNNQLTSLPAELRLLSSLRMLDVAHNQLTSLPAEVGYLRFLEELYVDHNQLTSLPAELGHLSSLQYLEASDNPLHMPPSKIIAQGATAIRQWLLAPQSESDISSKKKQNRFNKRSEEEQHTEIGQAEQLLQSGQERAAGTIAGVILESYLKKLCDRHDISYPEKAGLQLLIQNLRDGGAIKAKYANYLTYLASIRNKCAHSSPVTTQEVNLLVKEVKKFVDWVNNES